MSEGGIVSTFLLKGYNPPSTLTSQYIDPKKIIMHEDKPLLLIPYYSVNFQHFITETTPTQGASQAFEVSSATFNPGTSVIAFQNSLSIGSTGGMIMKWNSNVNLKTMAHDPHKKVFGTLYGKVISEYEVSFS